MSSRKFNKEKARQKANTVYLLSGLVYCGSCSASYIGNTITRNGVRHGYYECGARERTRTCKNRRVRKEVLENIVIQDIEQSIFAPAVREPLAEKILSYYNKHKKLDNSERDYLEKEIEQINVVIGNLVEAIESGQVSSVILDQIKNREDEVNVFKSRLRELDNQEDLSIGKNEILDYLGKLHEQFQEKENEEQLKSLIKRFTERATIFEDKIYVTTTHGLNPPL